MGAVRRPDFRGEHADAADRLTIGERRALWRFAAELADLTDDPEASRPNYARIVNSITRLLADKGSS